MIPSVLEVLRSPARSRTLTALLAAPVLTLAAACSSSAQPARPTQTVLREVVLSRPAAASLVSNILSDYQRSDWGAVRGSFSNVHVGQALLQMMLQWKADHVNNLRARVVHLAHLSGNREVGTIEFYEDPRAIPAYALYIFGTVNGITKVLGTTTGLHGSTYANADWSVTRTAHFVFYHSPYQLEGSDRSVMASLEFERTQFLRKFHLKLVPRINYYLYPVQSMMGPMTLRACGTYPDEVGCADPYSHPPSIHTVEWPAYHEPVHIFQLSLEPAVNTHSQDVYVAPLFIAEGMAVALEDKQLDPRLSDYCSDLVYIPLDNCARQSLGTKPLDLLSDSGFKRADPGHAYSLGGSFVKFLILKYGYPRFGKFYYVLAAQPGDGISDYNVATRKILHTSIQALLSVWQRDLMSG
jgi:hypothetical protein